MPNGSRTRLLGATRCRVQVLNGQSGKRYLGTHLLRFGSSRYPRHHAGVTEAVRRLTLALECNNDIWIKVRIDKLTRRLEFWFQVRVPYISINTAGST